MRLAFQLLGDEPVKQHGIVKPAAADLLEKVVLASQVHDCIAHGMAAMILDAAHLRGNEQKPAQ